MGGFASTGQAEPISWATRRHEDRKGPRSLNVALRGIGGDYRKVGIEGVEPPIAPHLLYRQRVPHMQPPLVQSVSTGID